MLIFRLVGLGLAISSLERLSLSGCLRVQVELRSGRGAVVRG